ncbi:hypothetical protein Mapa_014212 [Marchantia paleacea]|nr:hypothetical protein Mapa_014212 [Marchantia paleacea]
MTWCIFYSTCRMKGKLFEIHLPIVSATFCSSSTRILAVKYKMCGIYLSPSLEVLHTLISLSPYNQESTKPKAQMRHIYQEVCFHTVI